jgi:hypothetical protein
LSKYSTKSCCVIDNGLFQEAAQKLSESFGKVYYNAPWVADYPVSYHTEIGEGFGEYERIADIWGMIDDVDLFVFPDVYQGPLQEHLVKLGKRVWGSRNGDELELWRKEAKAHFKELGLPQGPYEVVKGMTALRKYIKSRDKEKLWVKISLTRGDTETFCAEGYDSVKNRLDDLQAKFGPTAEYREFIVDDHLPDTFDLAIDTYCIDGKFPSKSLLGNEQKDEGYIGVVKDWEKIPKGLTDVYEALSPDLKNFQYRNFFAIECRTGKDQMYLSDPCCRVGSPIFELELNMMKNLAEIIWEGAEGKLVEPEYKGKYGYEVILQSQWVNEHPLLVEYPEEFRDQIKFRYATRFPDGLWIMPQKQGPAFGSIVAYGDSIDACVAQVEEIAAEIKGCQVEAFTGSSEKLKKNLEELATYGVTF